MVLVAGDVDAAEVGMGAAAEPDPPLHAVADKSVAASTARIGIRTR
jgi:hypothetical protein